MKKLILITMLSFLTACSTSGYEKGINGNIQLYTLYNNLQVKQLDNINNCYTYSDNKSECSILAASVNTLQVLAGKAEPLRVAKSPGEIFESITKYGIDKTVQVFGYAAVAKVVEKGFDTSSKDPLVVEKEPFIVRPEIVQPSVIHNGGTTSGSILNTETISTGAAN